MNLLILAGAYVWILFVTMLYWRDRCMGRVKALRNRPGWKETEGDDWDLFYACTGWIHENLPYTGQGGRRLLDHQKVNHFPNHVEVRNVTGWFRNLLFLGGNVIASIR